MRDKTGREEERGLAEPPDGYLEFSGKTFVYLIPLVIPTLGVVFLTSWLTSVVLTPFYWQSVSAPEGSFLYQLMLYAIAPAILEEAVFRYLPMKLFAPYSKRGAIVVSSIYFAFFHMDFSKIPYAFFAGVIFMLINLAFGSIWPSVLLHLINNFSSLLWMRAEGRLAVIYVLILAFLSLFSLVAIFIMRRRYIHLACSVLRKSGEAYFTYLILLIPIISIIESTAKLIWGNI